MRQNFDPIRMGTRLARNWWTVTLRGVLAIIFGLVTLLWPKITLTALVFIFAAFVLVSGILLAIAAFRVHLTNTHGWLMLVEGAIGIGVGVLAFIWPGIATLMLLYLIAAWAIVTGIFEIIVAIQVRKEIENEWLLVLAGTASLLFGILLLIWPLAGALAILWIIAAYTIIFGILLLVVSLRLRSWGSERRLF
ncbi:HdeD family acid-resistance protein [Nostocaceae cyanobacterium CENA357]|uniref:HdeD family acid-resistance protein n=1 Tax=Atlanticothrix silvestris CENA357 TaxID=1725252 RepID=A0A8J7HEF4_9CYAN|nr:HdeD family acid-resistance protein [Atlanticothrix silvestris]MBH8551419.1 HdeD family acid-resistance protein [Atlanticothrix silvestris CENA357]